MVITSPSRVSGNIQDAIGTGRRQVSKSPREALAEDLFSRWNDLRTLRAPWEYYWQEINDLILPNSQSFQQSFTQGAPRTRKIFDGTAMLAANECSAGMQGMLCNPTERWMNTIPLNKSLIDDDDVLMWLEICADLVYTYLALPYSNFDSSISETLTSVIGYGTGCVYSEWQEGVQQMRYRTYPLAAIYCAENAMGRIDTVFRATEYTAKQAMEMWGEKCPKDIREMYEEKPDAKYMFLHIVLPRKDRFPDMPDNLNARYASYWLWVGGPPNQTGVVSSYIASGRPELITESGYHTMPYQVPRWQKIAGEIYGRSPAQNVMPDIKTLNSLSRVVLIAGEKLIDPPILIPDDGFMTPFKTVPGSLIKYDSSMMVNIQQQVVPLETKGNVGIGVDMMQQYQDRIERAFYIDQFRAQRKKERQSVPEIQDDRSQQMQILAPILARQQPELLAPLLHRTYDCLVRAGIMPPPPKKLRRAGINWEFCNQASRAQLYGKAAAIPQLVQGLTPLAQINQAVMDILDTDEAARQMADALDVTRKVIRSKRNLAAIRAKRQQDQDNQQAAANGAQMAAAAKDLATAHATAAGAPPLPSGQ